VVFLGLTPIDEARAKSFARRYEIDWPNGWGARELIEYYSDGWFPAILVIGRDGRVCWTDGAARNGQHPIAPELFAQIQNALEQ
jgi:hypothetical protein